MTKKNELSGFLNQYGKPEGFDQMPEEKQLELTKAFLKKAENRIVLKMLERNTDYQMIAEASGNSLSYVKSLISAVNRKRKLEYSLELKKLKKFLRKYPDIEHYIKNGKTSKWISEHTGIAYATVCKVNKFKTELDQIKTSDLKIEKDKKQSSLSRKSAKKTLGKYPEIIELLKEGKSQREIHTITGKSRKTVKKVSDSIELIEGPTLRSTQDSIELNIEKITTKIHEEREYEIYNYLEGIFEYWKTSKNYEEYLIQILNKNNFIKKTHYEFFKADFKKSIDLDLKDEIVLKVVEQFYCQLELNSDLLREQTIARFPNYYHFQKRDLQNAFQFYREALVNWKNEYLDKSDKKNTKKVIDKRLSILKEYLDSLSKPKTNTWLYSLACNMFLKEVKKRSYQSLKNQQSKRLNKRKFLRKQRLKNLDKFRSEPEPKDEYEEAKKLAIKQRIREEKIFKSKQLELNEKWNRRKRKLEFIQRSELLLQKLLDAGIDPWDSEWDTTNPPSKYENLFYKLVPLTDYWLEDRNMIFSLRKLNVERPKKIKPLNEKKACNLLIHLNHYNNLYSLEDVYYDENENANYPNKQLSLEF